VCEATKLEVIVSFLSTLALRNYFALSPELGREPELDERFVMSSNQAAQILQLPVPPSELEEQKHLLKAATGEGDEGPVVLGEVRGGRDEATGDHEGEGAELEKPIMRQALREEARKHIGDTGLLDHLLKHMASGSGGGTTRRAQWSTGWRRSARRLGWRDPIEGAMEYWLHAPVMNMDMEAIKEDKGLQCEGDDTVQQDENENKGNGDANDGNNNFNIIYSIIKRWK
ncbi:hypothetical protein GW17_00047026, partial [Ensete ventricosum]